MAFEIYKPRGVKMSKLPLVTLSKSSIVLNKHAREKLATEKVELAFDRDTGMLRIRASENGQIIKKTKIFSRGFFNHFDISKKGKFAAKFDEKEKALFVVLEETGLS
ncbi:MAG: hypothetical protein ACYC0Q_10030 [Eubacteriales bacterium]|nr:hypothetical protein [Bacillota bacterium]